MTFFTVTSFFTIPFFFASRLLALELIPIGVQQVSDIAPAAQSAARKSDVLLIPTDNLLASTVSIVAKIAVAQKVPLIVSDVLLVEQGAFAGQGVDYGASGAKAAHIASKVLFGGIKPFDIGLATPTPTKIVINKNTQIALERGNIQ